MFARSSRLNLSLKDKIGEVRVKKFGKSRKVAKLGLDFCCRMREANVDADIKSYTTSSVLRRDEYFFRIWYYASKIFK